MSRLNNQKKKIKSIMQFPYEIQTIINQYAKPASAMLRENWREGSSIIGILKQDRWWLDYRRECGRVVVYTMVIEGRPWKDFTFTLNGTWVEWCKDKMIIGPPRHRSSREEAELDEDYLTMEDIIRHCRPWSKTWPHPDDRSWCKVRAVPDWAIKEYLENK